LSLLVAGCFDKDASDGVNASGIISRDAPTTASGRRGTPFISGAPPAAVRINTEFSFTVEAWDPDGDDLSFSILNQPEWTDFDPSTGSLQGVPTELDAGDYPNITITVTDGSNTARIGPFTVQVLEDGAEIIELAWRQPLQNEDGTPLTDLAGYVIRYGEELGRYSSRIDIPNAGITRYVITGLAKGTYYFVLSSYNSTGFESDLSDPVEIQL
jgi:hypothetical protein